MVLAKRQFPDLIVDSTKTQPYVLTGVPSSDRLLLTSDRSRAMIRKLLPPWVRWWHPPNVIILGAREMILTLRKARKAGLEIGERRLKS